MHSKQTVTYICETYFSGNQYFYKKELITFDSWNNPSSLAWSTPRPISEKTFKRRKKEGYKVIYTYNEKIPAKVIPFSK
ncbi:hypothetical protein AJ85_21360 [Alkalihalobacillus alcalophilus ATCC 27647 = CGMCC 1.3604]|uniref:Uncharacterized protein n=1 Tax=Alkalihalobacillus alcalophilus ATCC 27647 = CGMCC 1.3604 TaxID=1218173 RepID=A0A094WJR5_ALKAL|nr:hypothetical protein [Alkalihalobacillus alcalophilus]KGA97076.1 hypothetical protein BALCAV_0212150 [Alkalihalobacillus alcalophilus ATCC 27647 = CGMCC 1.3604]MED1563044.1 hypothetical protein [Alkalihalobacillus alcalophilus]THG88797.1 hypothetical protein AJ85_21360 [Alkalihalobacillus alcalophilus ATCC 27647 = CGMCC 1.3604]